MGSLGGFAGWVAGWLGASGWVAGLVAWWLGSWPAGWVAGWVTGLVAWCLGCWLGGFGAWADWDSAGLGLGWVGRGRLAARLDWAWAWADWGSAGLGSVDWARLGGSTGARVHRGSGAGGLGVGARELERGLDWGVVGLGAAGLGTIVADGKRRRVKVGWAGTSQVARRCIRVGVWEVHGGCARKGGWIGSTGEHVSLDWMPSVSCVI